MNDLLMRVVENLLHRLTGPLTLRVILQPAMAMVLGVKAAIQDARLNRPAYFWAVVVDRAHRRVLLHDGWKDIARLFTAAIVVDVVYQIIALHRVYPTEAVLVGLVLAVVPYLLVRGPVNRVIRVIRSRHRKAT